MARKHNNIQTRHGLASSSPIHTSVWPQRRTKFASQSVRVRHIKGGDIRSPASERQLFSRKYDNLWRLLTDNDFMESPRSHKGLSGIRQYDRSADKGYGGINGVETPNKQKSLFDILARVPKPLANTLLILFIATLLTSCNIEKSTDKHDIAVNNPYAVMMSPLPDDLNPLNTSDSMTSQNISNSGSIIMDESATDIPTKQGSENADLSWLEKKAIHLIDSLIEGAEIMPLETQRPIVYIFSIGDATHNSNKEFPVIGGLDTVKNPSLGDFNIVLSFKGGDVDISVISRDMLVLGQKFNTFWLPDQRGIVPLSEVAKVALQQANVSDKEGVVVNTIQVPFQEAKKMVSLTLSSLGWEQLENDKFIAPKNFIIIRTPDGLQTKFVTNKELNNIKNSTVFETVQGDFQGHEIQFIPYQKLNLTSVDIDGQNIKNTSANGVLVLIEQGQAYSSMDIFKMFRFFMRTAQNGAGKIFFKQHNNKMEDVLVWSDIVGAVTRERIARDFIKEMLLDFIHQAKEHPILTLKRLVSVMGDLIMDSNNRLFINNTEWECKNDVCIVSKNPDRLSLPLDQVIR